MRRVLWWGLILSLCGWASGMLTEPASAAKVVTVMVPMRDGTLLATDVRLPAGDGPWPVVLIRTPYNKAGAADQTGIPVTRFLNSGIAHVAQDVRGRFASKGTARPNLDDGWCENQDGVDTVVWIRQQSWSNGKIATLGGSSLGDSQFMLAGAGPEGIVGQHYACTPFTSYGQEFYQNGVFLKADIEGWLTATGWPKEVLPLFRQHPRYDDFWRCMDLGTRLEQVHWPIVHLGGWFDVYTQGTLDAFTALQERGGEGARGQQHLLIGPWMHNSAWRGTGFSRMAGTLRFPENSVQRPGPLDEFGWLSHWLTGKPELPLGEPAVRYYVMGDVDDPQAPGNFWRAAESWPPPSRPLRLYFTPSGGLDPQPPAATTREYDYNPAKPVPTKGGSFDGPQDQRSVEGRADVLLFSTPPLTEPVEVTGRIGVRLYAATSARDTDFTAKLTDVYPDGRSMLLKDGIVRARYRQSVEQAEPITPGQTYAYDIDLWSTSIVFNRGHQIRVAISSSNAPRFEPNPNTGEDWPFQMPAVVAHQTIFLGGPTASSIVLPQIVGTGTP